MDLVFDNCPKHLSPYSTLRAFESGFRCVKDIGMKLVTYASPILGILIIVGLSFSSSATSTSSCPVDCGPSSR